MKTKFLLLFSFFCLYSYGQNNISGTITDTTTDKLISWADIILLKKEQIIYNTISNDQGYYEIKDIEAGTYTFKVNYLGYQDFIKIVTITPDSLEVLDIKLQNNIELLKEVVVTAETTTIQFKGDKRVITIGQDLISAGASTENILQQIPSIDIDISGNVSLRNDTNVIIMVDGKRSTLSSADIIAQIPANLIQKIEVITNPSAKYDAEGVSGMINIITKKLTTKGGNLGFNSGIGEEERHHFTFNGNYRSGKLNLYINYNYRAPYFFSTTKTTRQTENELIDQQTKNIFEDATVNYLKSGVDIFIDSTNTVSISGIYARNQHTLTNQTNTRILDNVVNEERLVSFNSQNTHTHVSKALNGNYRKEFNGRNHYLETDINYANFPNIFQLNQKETAINTSDFLIDDRQKRENIITTFSTDYYWNDQKQGVLETGIKAEFKNLDNTQNRTEQTQTTTAVNDNFLYKDRVLAAYAVYDMKIKNTHLKGGLRLEDYQIDLNSNNQKEFDNHYTNLFPSFSISYTFGKNEWSANYTRRISRPGVFSLNPFIVENGNLNRRRGNPFLRPSFANKIELNYNRKFEKFNINFSSFYAQVNDVIQFIFIREGDFLTSTFDNIGRSKQYGIEIFSKINWFTWWNTKFSLNYYFSEFETNQFDNTTTFSQRYRAQNDFKFTKTWSVQLNGNLNPRRQSLQQLIKTNYRVDLSIRKKFLQNKGQAILRVNDIFDTSEFKFDRTLANFNEKSDRKRLARFIYLTLKYNFSFGKKISNRQRKKRQYSSGNVD